jgi:ABC-2 type transport system permease protein
LYKEIALTTLKEESAYRTEIIVSFIGSMVSLAVWYFLWSAIFSAYGADTIQGFTFQTMITYLSVTAVLHFYNRSSVEYWIESDVRTGFVSMLMTKPFKYPVYYFFKDIGRFAFALIMRGVPLMLIAFVVLGIALPSNPLFFLSAALAFVINFLMMFMTGMWAFWSSGSIWGLRFTRSIISDIMSGSIIPIVLFPEWFRQVAYALPFQAIYSTPLLIYIGQTSGFDILVSLLVQLGWIAALGAAAFLIWKKAEKKTVSQGG